MKRERFKGTYFDVGKQKGLIYASNGLRTTVFPPVRRNLLREQIEIYQQYYPALIEEINGIAEGGKFNQEVALNYFLTSHVETTHPQGCTIFGVNNRNGIFIGRNYDWRFAANKLATLYVVDIKGKKKYVAVTDMWIPSTGRINRRFLTFNEEDIVNEDGLFMGMTYAYHLQRGLGICNSHAIKFVAENCATVEDALKFLKDVPISSPKNFVLADATGEMVVFEHASGRKSHVVRPVDDCLVKTNHYLSRLSDEEREVDWASKPEGTHYANSFTRYGRVQKLLEGRTKELVFDDVTCILTDKQVRVHNTRLGIKTIWSLVLDLRNRRYLVCQDDDVSEFTRLLT